MYIRPMMLSYQYGGYKDEIKLIASILSRKNKEAHSTETENKGGLLHKLTFKDIIDGESHFNEIKKNTKSYDTLKYIANKILEILPEGILKYFRIKS